jgi:hypothetical protein
VIDRKTKRENQTTWQEALKSYKRYLAEAKSKVKFWKEAIKEWEAEPPKKGDIYSKRQDV